MFQSLLVENFLLTFQLFHKLYRSVPWLWLLCLNYWLLLLHRKLRSHYNLLSIGIRYRHNLKLLPKYYINLGLLYWHCFLMKPIRQYLRLLALVPIIDNYLYNRSNQIRHLCRNHCLQLQLHRSSRIHHLQLSIGNDLRPDVNLLLLLHKRLNR